MKLYSIVRHWATR